MLSANVDVSATVLKVAHHGSAGSSSSEFLEAVNPQYAVISVGADNDYGHPTEATLNRLSASISRSTGRTCSARSWPVPTGKLSRSRGKQKPPPGRNHPRRQIITIMSETRRPRLSISQPAASFRAKTTASILKRSRRPSPPGTASTQAASEIRRILLPRTDAPDRALFAWGECRRLNERRNAGSLRNSGRSSRSGQESSRARRQTRSL